MHLLNGRLEMDCIAVRAGGVSSMTTVWFVGKAEIGKYMLM